MTVCALPSPLSPLSSTRCAIVIAEMEMKKFVLITCLLCASSLFAGNCVKNRRGQTVCSNGKTAVAVNPNTGNAAVAQKNSNGVTTTQTSNGGQAKTKNGKGVAQGPGGTTCVKTANNQGCTK